MSEEAALPAITMNRKGRTTRQYRLTGTVNGKDYDNDVVRVTRDTEYAWASLTAIPEYRYDESLPPGERNVPTGGTVEVLTFHHKEENARRGNLDLRAAATGVRVIEVRKQGDPA